MVTKAKYLGMEITNDLNWGASMQTTAANSTKTNAFIHRNLRQLDHYSNKLL